MKGGQSHITIILGPMYFGNAMGKCIILDDCIGPMLIVNAWIPLWNKVHISWEKAYISQQV